MSWIEKLAETYDVNAGAPGLCPLYHTTMTAHLIVTIDEKGNFVSAADVWNAEKLEELFTRLNPNRKLRLEREKAQKKDFS